MAIALDNSNYPGESSGVTMTSDSYINAGSGLFAGIEGDTTSDLITGVTWNGVAMTLVGKIKQARWAYLFGISNASVGTANLVVNASSSTVIGRTIASYTGVGTIPDASTTGTTTSAALTLSVTAIAANCWTIMFGHAANPIAGAGTTVRVTGSGFGLGDSNGPVGPGSTSLSFTNTVSWAGVMCSFAPGGQNSAFLLNFF